MTEQEQFEDLEEILRRQDQAFALMEQLRSTESDLSHRRSSEGKSNHRRWPIPDGVTLELHNGQEWVLADCVDIGVGGARLKRLPFCMLGPVPSRLSAPDVAPALVLSDVMWRECDGDATGVCFEFMDNEEMDRWAGGLIDALLAKYSIR